MLKRKAAIGLFQRDPHGQVVDDLDRLDPLEKRLLRILAHRIARPVEGEFHVARVKRGAIMERHARVQIEGVAQPILGNLPAFREARTHRPIRPEPRQPLEHVGIEHLVDGARGGTCRVKMRRFKLQSDREVALRLRGDPCHSDGARERRSCHQFHADLLRYPSGSFRAFAAPLCQPFP
jgi:hypothetical protein